MQEATQTLHVFGRITKRRRTQLYVTRTTSSGHIRSQFLKNKQKDVIFPRVTHCATKKEYIFPVLFLGYFFFFLSFSIFLKSLKKNKRTLRYKGGMSFSSILVPSARNTLMLKARRHVQEKDTQGKFLHGSRCQVIEAKCYKACI
jgi:hypothetical protein